MLLAKSSERVMQTLNRDARALWPMRVIVNFFASADTTCARIGCVNRSKSLTQRTTEYLPFASTS